jgi:tRNA (adenine22-N1)-methyltransferase
MGGYAGANLWFLSDILPFKVVSFIPTQFVSPGDILLGVGVLLTVQRGMAGYSRGKHARRGRKPAASHRRDGRPRLEAMDAAVTPPVPAAEALAVSMAEPPRVPPAPAPAVPEPEASEPSAPELPAPIPMVWERPAEEPQHVAPAEPAHSETNAASRPDPMSREHIPDLQFLQTAPPSEFAFEQPDGSPAPSYNPVRLSPRLETIARMTERGACVADVGCDHGKLAAWLALAGVPDVIAMDVSAKSLSKTKQLVAELDIRQSVQTRVSDGLKKLRHGEAQTIVMAGMGGPTICGILEESREKALAAEKLLLQPMNAVGTVRKWLIDNGFRISDERLAEEDNRIYQILAAVPGDDPYPPMSLFDLEVGRLLMECRHPLLGKLLNNKIETIDTILSEIADNATPKAQARREELIALRQRCQEVLEWLAG